MLLKTVYRYAHSIERRFFLLYDYFLQAARGKRLGAGIIANILRNPSVSEDFVNLLCFLDPKNNIFLIDVGANVGDFTADFIECFPNTKAILFEPASTNYAFLEKRFKDNSSIKLVHCALSSECSERELWIGPKSTLHSLERYTEEANISYDMCYDSVERVQVQTLDQFSLDLIGQTVVLKIDVQGHEVEMLKGSVSTLDSVDVCIIECSFADEYEGKEPSFSAVTCLLREYSLYPIIFQDIGRATSNYGFERDIIFVKRNLLNRVFFLNYGS